MKRTWPIIGVADVPESYRWYGSLLGLPKTARAHDAFGQIADLDGTVLPRLGRARAPRAARESNTGTAEFSLRDPDEYYVTISALDPTEYRE